MAFKKSTLGKFEKLIKRFVNYLKFRAIGPHVLSKDELKDLLRSGLVNVSQPTKTAVARSYLKTHQQIAQIPAAKTTRDGAIDFLERIFSRYADKMGESMATDFINQIEASVMPFTDRTEGKKIYEVLKDKDIHSKYLGNVLNDQVKDWTHRWKLIVGTELSRASNYGAMDAILHNNRDKTPEEIYCYKIGPHDASTCEECLRFWFLNDGTTPKVYTMAELASGGTNIGKKRIDWLPTIDNTHPNERHKLVELKPGWGFKNGTLIYVGENYDEYKKQRNKQ